MMTVERALVLARQFAARKGLTFHVVELRAGEGFMVPGGHETLDGQATRERLASLLERRLIATADRRDQHTDIVLAMHAVRHVGEIITVHASRRDGRTG